MLTLICPKCACLWEIKKDTLKKRRRDHATNPEWCRECRTDMRSVDGRIVTGRSVPKVEEFYCAEPIEDAEDFWSFVKQELGIQDRKVA